jgi:hypothetical protein
MIYYTAIIFFPPAEARQPAKYRNINNLENFEAWALRQSAIYVNYYLKTSKLFSHRTWLQHYNNPQP